MKELWLICGPPIYTSVARWEEHLALLRSRPNLLGQEDHIRHAEEHIAWLKALGDPYPDRGNRAPAPVVPATEVDLQAMERELDRQQRTRREGREEGQG